MNVLFVCTGNLCRSPMGELLAGAYLAGTSVTASSAGTLGLASHVIDPNSARVLEKARIAWNGDADASLPTCISPAAIAGFRSRRLTLDIAAGSDLILCFEKRQIEQVVTLCPSCVRRVFLLTRFARICSLCAERGLVTGWTVADRLRSIIDESPLVLPLVQPAGDIADPRWLAGRRTKRCTRFSAVSRSGVSRPESDRNRQEPTQTDADSPRLLHAAGYPLYPPGMLIAMAYSNDVFPSTQRSARKPQEEIVARATPAGCGLPLDRRTAVRRLGMTLSQARPSCSSECHSWRLPVRQASSGRRRRTAGCFARAAETGG